MAEKDTQFSSKIKYTGIFSFSDFYNFCYIWLTEDELFIVKEDKYTEKIVGDGKNIDIEWTAEKKITDYFKYQLKIKFRITAMKKVEVPDASGKKIKTNDGAVEVILKGILLKDYESKFEATATRKFLRGIYEKWIIAARVDEFQTDIVKKCNDFLEQAKAFLDLEGKK